MSSLPPPATVSTQRTEGFFRNLKAHWIRFKQQRNTGSNPSMFDREGPSGSTDASETQLPSANNPDERLRKRDVYYAIPFHKTGQRSRDGDESFGRFKPRRSKPNRRSAKMTGSETVDVEPDDLGDVDEVVVDNSFEVGGPHESLTEPSGGPVPDGQPNVAMQAGQGKITGGAYGWDPKDKNQGLNLGSSQHTHSQHDTGSLAHTGGSSLHLERVLRVVRHFWIVVWGVFFPSFDDKEFERQYRSQEWYLGKMLALIASLFLVLNWILACVFVPRPFVLMDTIFHFAISPILTLPLPIMIIFRWPLSRPIFYQIYLGCSIWCWSYYNSLSVVLCGFYTGHGYFSCGGKDFIGLWFFATGYPALALFAMGQRRFSAAVWSSILIIFSGVFVVPYRKSWSRIIANQILYHGFLIYVHWAREMSDRDRFVMSKQIKDAYLYRHRLQMREKQIQTSKQRLTGYIFHEVRVPLNTAMLAVQNIEASGTIARPLELEFNALSGSLTVMSKVLNDVLDLNRMDAGRFESVNKPYSFHKVIDSLLVPLRLAASAKGLNLSEDLDHRIDEFALECLKSARKAKGEQEDPDEQMEPLVVGDEMRLRQIFTNLTSNATKFSPPGGRIEVVTKLLWPSPPGAGAVSPIGPGDNHWMGSQQDKVASEGTSNGTTAISEKAATPDTIRQGSLGMLPLGGKDKEKLSLDMPALPITVPVDQIIIRIEVRDTGMGIKRKDIRDAKLFSPYVQTEIGRYQGGKGSGLGLALVRRIVKLSGGRLGVKSKFNQGSCFWVELPLGVGNRALHQSADGASQDVSIRSRSQMISRARDFALDQPLVDRPFDDALPNEEMNFAPPIPHISHRTIMEQHGLVELTPSRPELHNRSMVRTREHPIPETSTLITPKPLLTSFPTDGDVMTMRTVQPARHDTNNSAPAALDPNPSSPPELLSVLVVDDDPLTRKLMTRMLSRMGCVVSTAEHGVAALEILLGAMFTPSSEMATPTALNPSTPGSSADETTAPSQPRAFDVVFLDNQMPKMSGLETIARLRAAGREDFVVGVTGNALIRDQDEYLNAGVDHVLIKPVLEKSLKQMLTLASQRRRLV